MRFMSSRTGGGLVESSYLISAWNDLLLARSMG